MTGRLSRRQFVVGAGTAGLGLLAGCGRLPWQAPRPPRPARLGLLSLVPPSPLGVKWQAAFLEGMREHGYEAGQNLVIERRDAGGRPERYPALAAELIALPVDLIFNTDPAGALAAKQATGTIPIVVPVGDLVGNGLVASLARPGGNVTGLTNFSVQLVEKRLELLKEAVPGVSRIAVIHNPANPPVSHYLQEALVAARALDLSLEPLEVRDSADLEPAFALGREHAQAVLILTDGTTSSYAARIVDLAAQSRLPSMFQEREFVEEGGLIAYGPSTAAHYRRAAYYVDRILKGAKPADLPVEQPMVFDFVVNMKTAQALGITFPNEIMLQVTEVIR